jgi:hypothetical protein
MEDFVVQQLSNIEIFPLDNSGLAFVGSV